MEPQNEYPKYRIFAAYQRGQQLTPNQRTSGRFDPEPRIGPWTFRPGQKPVEISEAQFKAVSTQIRSAFEAGSVKVEVMTGPTGNWFTLGSDAAPASEALPPAPPAPPAENTEPVKEPAPAPVPVEAAPSVVPSEEAPAAEGKKTKTKKGAA